MADPFEVRMRFTSLLTHLSASQTSSVKTASYALKHRDMDEDLHSCILESLDIRTNPAATMNSRANVMYFLEHLCDMAVREEHTAYVDMVRRDIGRIVACVVGIDSGQNDISVDDNTNTTSDNGAATNVERDTIRQQQQQQQQQREKSVGANGANIKVVRKVVGELGPQGKGLLAADLVRGIEEDLRRWEAERARTLQDEGEQQHKDGKGDGEHGSGGAGHGKSERDASGRGGDHQHRHTPRLRDGKINGVNRVDKRAIEQRVEEDRERNKRLRESVWAINGDDDDELDKLWEDTSDLNDDDYAIGREEAEERKQFARYYVGLLQEVKG